MINFVSSSITNIFRDDLSSFRSRRSFDALLIFRAMCIFGIFCSHFFGLGYANSDNYLDTLKNSAIHLSDYVPHWALWAWPSTGSNFAYSLLVLSGYLIGKQFYDEEEPLTKEKILSFYKRRSSRILPLYYVNLIFCLALGFKSNPKPLQMVGSFFLIDNFTGRSINTVSWFASTIMQLYLLTPLLVALCPSKKIQNFLVLTLLAVVIGVPKTPFCNYAYYIMGFSIHHLIVRRPKSEPKIPLLVGLAPFFIGTFAFYALNWLHYEAPTYPICLVTSMISVYCLDHVSPIETVEGADYFLFGIYMFCQLSFGFFLWHLPILLTQHYRTFMLLAYLKNNMPLSQSREFLVFYSSIFIQGLIYSVVVSLLTYLFIEKRFYQRSWKMDSGNDALYYLAKQRVRLRL